jgi:hypothetical protein
MSAEVMLNNDGDMRIYHVQRQQGDYVTDVFYVDGNGRTAVATFKSSLVSYGKYGAKIRGLMQGIGKGQAPQG